MTSKSAGGSSTYSQWSLASHNSLLTSYADARGWPGNFKPKHMSIMDRKMAEARARVQRDAEANLGIGAAKKFYKETIKRDKLMGKKTAAELRTEAYNSQPRYDERIYGAKPKRMEAAEHAFGQQHKGMDTRTTMHGGTFQDISNNVRHKKVDLAAIRVAHQGDNITGREQKVLNPQSGV